MQPALPALTWPGRVFEVTRGSLVEIISGEGGLDAKKFALELTRAYLTYAARNGLTPEMEESSESKYSFLCPGAAAEALFARESGVHCIQRIPDNDRHGRRQTSYVAVLATPLLTYGFTVREEDLVEDFQRGHGKGGQHQNKTSSAVRLRHAPTGLEVFINGRSQLANRRTARLCLAAKVKAWADQQRQSLRPGQPNACRGMKIRTFNLTDNRVTDHRTGIKLSNPEKILREGSFDLLK